MPDSADAVRAQIATLLQTADTGRLLRELEALARDNDDFAACADLWAPALYDRNALLFEPFLVRRLDDSQDAVIRDVLARAEHDGHDALFTGIYRKVADEESWNVEMAAFAAAAVPDADLLRMTKRRDIPGRIFALQEPTALAWYQRDPAVFGAFVREHALPGYDYQRSRSRAYHDVRAAALAQGDEDLNWWLFRRFATPAEWTAELGALLAQRPPVAEIVADLRTRQLERPLEVDPAILLAFMAQYGADLIPYIEPNLNWIGHIPADTLLPAVAKLDDLAFYRRVFFRYGEPQRWRQQVQDLVKSPVPDADLAHALARWTPPSQQWTQQAWKLDHGTALALYQRNPTLFRPFLVQTVHEPDAALLDAAERQGDEELLDVLTFGFLDHLSTQIATTYPGAVALTLADLSAKQRAWAAPLSQRIVARFDRLAAANPGEYVRHASIILSRGMGAAWKLKDDATPNPVAYLFQQHRAAWRASSFGLRELLETPDHTIITLALDILSAGGTEAAQRVAENALALQALLLGQDSGKFKKQALKCMDQAAYANPAVAAQMTPLLQELMYFRGERAIEERAMVSFVRARHAARAEASA